MSENSDYKAAYERQKLARARAEDILENKSRELYEKNQSLLEAYNKLKGQKAQLLHQEKLASIGQLSAGVAHEINNPTGFVKSNINALKRYSKDIKKLFNIYDESYFQLHQQNLIPEEIQRKIEDSKKAVDINFLLDDLGDLIDESLTGLLRIEEIVKSLKTFARPGSDQSECYNINDCINNTIKLVWNEIKYKAELKTYLSEVPDSIGYPGEIGQIIVNLLVNAAHAIENSGTITIRTEHVNNDIELRVEDDGAGIDNDHLHQIFDPFFTTKDVDKGTGLGLSITHGIVKKHRGQIEVISGKNEGTSFLIKLPVLTCSPQQ